MHGLWVTDTNFTILAYIISMILDAMSREAIKCSWSTVLAKEFLWVNFYPLISCAIPMQIHDKTLHGEISELIWFLIYPHSSQQNHSSLLEQEFIRICTLL